MTFARTLGAIPAVVPNSFVQFRHLVTSLPDAKFVGLNILLGGLPRTCWTVFPSRVQAKRAAPEVQPSQNTELRKIKEPVSLFTSLEYGRDGATFKCSWQWLWQHAVAKTCCGSNLWYSDFASAREFRKETVRSSDGYMSSESHSCMPLVDRLDASVGETSVSEPVLGHASDASAVDTSGSTLRTLCRKKSKSNQRQRLQVQRDAAAQEVAELRHQLGTQQTIYAYRIALQAEMLKVKQAKHITFRAWADFNAKTKALKVQRERLQANVEEFEMYEKCIAELNATAAAKIAEMKASWFQHTSAWEMHVKRHLLRNAVRGWITLSAARSHDTKQVVRNQWDRVCVSGARRHENKRRQWDRGHQASFGESCDEAWTSNFGALQSARSGSISEDKTSASSRKYSGHMMLLHRALAKKIVEGPPGLDGPPGLVPVFENCLNIFTVPVSKCAA